ncbi:MAG: thiamine pyrophosphate-binding protein [Chloroflexota bacterium]|nr:thiamine pyrophosphate-binding protein [Chloroflexota bacterium]
MTEILNRDMPPDLSMDDATAAQIAVATLERHGVDVVFGIPGVHTLALYDALSTSPIRHVLARHEGGAGFMADGYARATGRPGVAVVITGPGITNIATPVGEAYADSSPLLILSANVPNSHIDKMRGNLHDLKDQLGLMRTITKWNARVERPDEVEPLLSEALHCSTTGRHRPVHVEIPLDILDMSSGPAREWSSSIDKTFYPSPELVDEAVARLQGADRVVIYCGGGAVSSGAGESIAIIAEHFSAPVITSIMGKGSIPEDHPLALGALWSPGNAVDELVRTADCLLVFGSKLGAQATENFDFPLPPELIRVEIDSDEMFLNARPSLPIVADARLAAEAIAALLVAQDSQRSGCDPEQVTDVRRRAQQHAFGVERLDYLAALRDALPRDGISCWDMTMMSYAACGLFPVYSPRTFFFPSGFGTLGFALPVALGAKIARPEIDVMCVCGDGGFQFTMQETATAVEQRLGVPIVIFNDSTYSAVKEEQSRKRNGRFIAVDLTNPDYVALAGAYGIPAVRAYTPDELARAVREAFTRNLPTIIDVPIAPWV